MKKLIGDGIEFSDHDLLIRVDAKVDGLTSEVKDMKTDIITRVSKTEARLDSVDLYHATYPAKDLWEVKTWSEGFRANIKFMMVATGLLFGSIGAITVKVIETVFKLK